MPYILNIFFVLQQKAREIQYEPIVGRKQSVEIFSYATIKLMTLIWWFWKWAEDEEEEKQKKSSKKQPAYNTTSMSDSQPG